MRWQLFKEAQLLVVRSHTEAVGFLTRAHASSGLGCRLIPNQAIDGDEVSTLDPGLLFWGLGTGGSESGSGKVFGPRLCRHGHTRVNNGTPFYKDNLLSQLIKCSLHRRSPFLRW